MSRPGRNVRRFGEVLAVVWVESGEPRGCELRLGQKIWRLPHFPMRLWRVEILPGERLRVSFKDGTSRLLEDCDRA